MSRFETGEIRASRLAAAGILQRYRRLILLGRLPIAHDAARLIVGPDCAYHLYGRANVRPRRSRPKR